LCRQIPDRPIQVVGCVFDGVPHCVAPKSLKSNRRSAMAEPPKSLARFSVSTQGDSYLSLVGDLNVHASMVPRVQLRPHWSVKPPDRPAGGRFSSPACLRAGDIDPLDGRRPVLTDSQDRGSVCRPRVLRQKQGCIIGRGMSRDRNSRATRGGQECRYAASLERRLNRRRVQRVLVNLDRRHHWHVRGLGRWLGARREARCEAQSRRVG